MFKKNTGIEIITAIEAKENISERYCKSRRFGRLMIGVSTMTGAFFGTIGNDSADNVPAAVGITAGIAAAVERRRAVNSVDETLTQYENSIRYPLSGSVNGSIDASNSFNLIAQGASITSLAVVASRFASELSGNGQISGLIVPYLPIAAINASVLVGMGYLVGQDEAHAHRVIDYTEDSAASHRSSQ